MIDPVVAANEDCDTAVNEGSDPVVLRDGPLGADESLINAMGRRWVIEAAGGVDDTNEAWEELGLPWCARYNAAYRARAAKLAEVQS